MRNIKDAERMTGISRQNIRYYERQGLLSPARNRENAYRQYTQEDIVRLKQIKLFRKLDMPVGDIRRLFKGEISLEEAVEKQICRLESEKEKLTAALDFCASIRESQLADMDVDDYLEQMEEKEHKGLAFRQFVQDYCMVVKSEMIREFSFMPDTWCRTPQEFTEALYQYGKENKLPLVVLKESMAPRLMIDGIEYKACRTSSRFGIVIHCEIAHPEDYIPEGMSKKKYLRYRILSIAALPVIFFVICNMWILREIDFHNVGSWIGLLSAGSVFVADLFFIYYCYGKNFRG